ncbi:MAG: LytR family transcriptional regulator, partial [Candidatus Moraniibacteriota bacterium]
MTRVTLSWIKWLLVVLCGLIVLGRLTVEFRNSLVSPESRFNLVYVNPVKESVSVVTFDPVERKILQLNYPSSLEINSRSEGTYAIKNLYKLGNYKSQGGEFARRKVQGFMRLPIVGYVVGDRGDFEKDLIQSLGWGKVETNLTLIDRIYLILRLKEYNKAQIDEGELLRLGILIKSNNGDGYNYQPERMLTYVGKSFFDWGVGKEGATVAIINESGIDGMGSDVAAFLTSLGLDVVMVRSGTSVQDKTKYIVSDPKNYSKALQLIENVFHFPKYEVGETTEYRAAIVFWIGKDALE